MGDVILGNVIVRKPNRVLVSFGFKELADLEVREGCIGTERAGRVPLCESRNHGFQNIVPAVGGVEVTGSQSAAFQITVLIKNEQRMIARSAEVVVVGCSLLFATS